MNRRHSLSVLAGLCTVLMFYIFVDYSTSNFMNRSSTFIGWHGKSARQLVDAIKLGQELEWLSNGNFFPMWGSTFLLALTDFGLLANRSFLAFRAAIIIPLALSVWVGAELLRIRYGRVGWWAGWLMALNPVSLQLIGGVYDAMLSSAWFALAGMVFIYAELAPERQWRWYAIAGGLLGLCFNIRSDMLYPVVGAIVVAALWDRRPQHLARLGLVVGLIALCLAPWTLAQHQRWGNWSPTSANTGHVAFISLGQIEDAAWDVKHIDGYRFDEVDAEILPRWGARLPADNHYARMYSPPASAVYFRMFRVEVMANPRAYIRGLLQKGEAILTSDKLGVLIRGECMAPNANYRKLLPLKKVCSDRIFSTSVLTAFVNGGLVIMLWLGGWGLVNGPRRAPLLAFPGLIGSATFVLLCGFQYLERHLYSVTGMLGLVWLVAALELVQFLLRRRQLGSVPELQDLGTADGLLLGGAIRGPASGFIELSGAGVALQNPEDGLLKP